MLKHCLGIASSSTSLKIISFHDINVCFPLASVCVPGKQILIMNRRAEGSIITLGTINSTSRQIVLRDSGK